MPEETTRYLKPATQVKLFVLTVFLLLAFAHAAASAEATTITPIDLDHGLNDSSSIESYTENGYAETQLQVPEMKISVSADHGDVDLDGIRRDKGITYLRIQYQEDIPRKLRVYIPEEYWSPVENLGKKPVAGGPTADFEITDGGRTQSVTLKVNGPTDAVYAVSSISGAVFSYLERPQEIVGELSGRDINVIADTQQWQYPPEEALLAEGNGSIGYGIESGSEDNGVLVQYQTGEESWATAPDCRRMNMASPPVCKMMEGDVHDRVYVVPRVDDPPAIRYKQQPNFFDRVGNSIDDLASIPGKISDLLFGGKESEG